MILHDVESDMIRLIKVQITIAFLSAVALAVLAGCSTLRGDNGEYSVPSEYKEWAIEAVDRSIAELSNGSPISSN